MTTPSLDTLLEQIRQHPDQVEFDTVQAVIQANYHYQPTAFRNGAGADLIHNPAGSNDASCRIFAFARLHQLTDSQALACFGHIYRDKVLGNPAGTDHANIRTFLRHGWPGIQFDGEPLTAR